MSAGPETLDQALERERPLVGIVMGSRSDLPTLQKASEVLAELGVPHERRVVSAHRTPDWMREYQTRALPKLPIWCIVPGQFPSRMPDREA